VTTDARKTRRVAEWLVSQGGRLVPWLVPVLVLVVWQVAVSLGWL
jgi:hypothetical protein